MRWVASLVAETHRIMSRGGIFIYPSDQRKNYTSGRLRMIYECAPIAFLIEQAGGSATDCVDRILEIPARALHSRTPFAFGSKEEVAKLQAYHEDPHEDRSPLFSRRGLFN
jgi:fructose-1,6-bisphosphatase I